MAPAFAAEANDERSNARTSRCPKRVVMGVAVVLTLAHHHLVTLAAAEEEPRLAPCVSPPASEGTRSTGVTGIQGPTRWRADGSSP